MRTILALALALTAATGWAAVTTGPSTGGGGGPTNGITMSTMLTTLGTNTARVVTVSPRGIANGTSAIANNGANFGPDTSGTTTSGIQEAINALPTGTNWGPAIAGGTLEFADGDFFFTNSIYYTNRFTATIALKGGSTMNSRLIYAGTQANTNLIYLRGGSNTNLDGATPSLSLPLQVFAQNLVFSSLTEKTNALLCVTNISAAEFLDCRFVSWASMTNQPYGSAASVGPISVYPGPQGNVGLVVGNVNDHWVTISKCSFQGLATGIAAFTDHLFCEDIKFAAVGSTQSLGQNNLFPTTSPYSLGAAIYRRPGLDSHYRKVHFYSVGAGIYVENFTTTSDQQFVQEVLSEGVVSFELGAFTTNGVSWLVQDSIFDGTFARVATNGAGVYSFSTAPLAGQTAVYAPGIKTSPNTTNLNALQITSGTLGTARLGSGTANASTFLRGDQTWGTPSGTTFWYTNPVYGGIAWTNATGQSVNWRTNDNNQNKLDLQVWNFDHTVSATAKFIMDGSGDSGYIQQVANAFNANLANTATTANTALGVSANGLSTYTGGVPVDWITNNRPSIWVTGTNTGAANSPYVSFPTIGALAPTNPAAAGNGTLLGPTNIMATGTFVVGTNSIHSTNRFQVATSANRNALEVDDATGDTYINANLKNKSGALVLSAGTSVTIAGGGNFVAQQNVSILNAQKYFGWNNGGLRLYDADSSTLLLSTDNTVANSRYLKLGGVQLTTNGVVANPVAGRMYSTNGASAVTFGAFASVPTDSYTKSVITVSNTTAATPFQVIFPNGTRATNGVPATFDVQGSTEAIFEVHHNAQRSTNVVRVF